VFIVSGQPLDTLFFMWLISFGNLRKREKRIKCTAGGQGIFVVRRGKVVK